MPFQVCPFEPVKVTVRGYVKEVREMKKAMEIQEDEVCVLIRLAHVCIYESAYERWQQDVLKLLSGCV